MQRILLFLLIASCFVAIYIVFDQQTLFTKLQEPEQMKQWILQWEALGPLMIIFIMTIAIVFSPLPSAPVALASGALYGHYEGTLYVLIGSELGAIIAFLISRYFGAHFVHRIVDEKWIKGLFGSQNGLMGVVFISRLLPFLSFDVISYAAGLTVLRFWRFALATFAGILPASFLLAHVGSEISTTESSKTIYAVLFLGAFMLVPFLFRHKIKRYTEHMSENGAAK